MLRGREQALVGLMILSACDCGGGGSTLPGADSGPPEADAATLDAGDANAPIDGFSATDQFASDIGADNDAGDGCECPPDEQCAFYECDEGGGCRRVSLADGSPCSPTETMDGVCVVGSCRVRGCGDGFLEPGPSPTRESCDDGNVDPGDSCSPLCEPTPYETRWIEPDSSWEFGGYAQPESIGVDGSGGVLLVWTEQSGVDGRIWGQRLSPTGVPQGDVVLVSGTRAIRTSVAGLAGGGFVVAWEELEDQRIWYRLLYPSGALGVARLASEDLDAQESDVSVAALGDGFVLAWEDRRDRFPIDPRGGVYFRRFARNGNPLDSSGRRAADDVTGEQRAPRIAVDGSTWMVAWLDLQSDGSRTIEGRRFTGSSEVDTADTKISATGDRVSRPAVSAASRKGDGPGDSGFVVTWAVTGGANAGVWARGVRDGGMATATFVALGSQPSVIPLPGEAGVGSEWVTHYLVVYLDESGGADFAATRALHGSAATLRSEIAGQVSTIGAAPSQGGTWFHYLLTTVSLNDSLNLFHLPDD